MVHDGKLLIVAIDDEAANNVELLMVQADLLKQCGVLSTKVLGYTGAGMCRHCTMQALWYAATRLARH